MHYTVNLKNKEYTLFFSLLFSCILLVVLLLKV